MAKAQKNIFGEYIKYQSPILTEEQKAIVEATLNGLASQIEAQIPHDELLAYYAKPIDILLQFIVPQIDQAVDFVVDGRSIQVLTQKVVAERVEQIRAALEAEQGVD